MNASRFLLSLIVLVLCSRAPLALGQELPAPVRNTTNGPSARSQITPFVEERAAALKADEADAAGKLIAEVLAPPGPNAQPPSAVFMDVYADVVNAKLLELANSENPRVRLNAAIVAAKIAEKAGNARLIPTIVDLLDDSNEAVVSWALKATKGVLIPAHTPAAGVQGTKLMPAFIAAAKKNVASGPMTQAAYDALRVVEVGSPPAPAIKAAIDAAHEIFKARRELYLKGVPDFPSSESTVISFLSREKIWKIQVAQQQLTTIQLISDMTGVIAQRFPNANTIVRGELAGMLKTNGGALLVIGTWSNTSAKMEAFAKPLSQVGPTNTPDTVTTRAKAVFDGLAGINAFKDLKPPPTVENP